MAPTASSPCGGASRWRGAGFLAQLDELCGIRLEDFGVLVAPDAAPDAPGECEARFAGESVPEQTGTLLAEEIRRRMPRSMPCSRAAGHPALTARSAGRGVARYLATVPDDAGAFDWALVIER